MKTLRIVTSYMKYFIFLDMFKCPNCKTKIPLWKAFFLNNFTKIKCRGCNSTLKPNRQTMEKVGGTGVAIALPFIFIAYNFFGVIGAIIGIIVGYVIASIITMKITKFEIYKKGEK